MIFNTVITKKKEYFNTLNLFDKKIIQLSCLFLYELNKQVSKMLK